MDRDNKNTGEGGSVFPNPLVLSKENTGEMGVLFKSDFTVKM